MSEFCLAELSLGDDYGDNSTTFRCGLPEGHEGPHVELCRTDDDPPHARQVETRWVGDDRVGGCWQDYLNACFSLCEDEDEYEDEVMPEGWDWKPLMIVKLRHDEADYPYADEALERAWDMEIVEAGKQGWPAE